MKTLAQKRQAKKDQLNKEAKLKMKICFFSCFLLIGGILYAAIENGVANNNIFFF